MKRVKAWLKRLDERLGAWLMRKFPKLAQQQSQEFGAGASFGGDLQIKVIRGKPNEKEKSCS